MKSRTLARIACLLAMATVGAAFCSCSVNQGEGFAIYLTKEDVPPAQMEALSHVERATEAVFTVKDILSYDAVTHEIKLKQEAYDRITALEVPVKGKSFLVCIDKAPVYGGAFWVMFSSQSFDGVTILKPIGPQEGTSITLSLGYPSGAFYSGDDPRDNASVMKSLDLAGKLIHKP